MPTLRLLALALLLSAAGCKSNAINQVTLSAVGEPETRLIVNDDLQDEVEVVRGEVLYEGDLLVGVVTLQSHADEKMLLDYKWEWKDQDGYPKDGNAGAPWQRVFVEAGERKQVQGRAPEPGAVQGIFNLRYPTGYDAD